MTVPILVPVRGLAAGRQTMTGVHDLEGEAGAANAEINRWAESK